MLLKMSTAHIKGWIGGGGGASVHDQTSVSHWSPLWHFRLGVVAIEEEGGGGEWM